MGRFTSLNVIFYTQALLCLNFGENFFRSELNKKLAASGNMNWSCRITAAYWIKIHKECADWPFNLNRGRQPTFFKRILENLACGVQYPPYFSAVRNDIVTVNTFCVICCCCCCACTRWNIFQFCIIIAALECICRYFQWTKLLISW